MQKYGYLEIAEEKTGRFIQLKQSGNYLTLLDISDRQALLDVKAEFGTFSQNDLIRFTYQKYPYYAIKSAIARELLTDEEMATIENQKRTFTEPQLFSIGYEGISLETYINKLILNDVHVLCDVRKCSYINLPTKIFSIFEI
jgi:hypothetical protein